jgi:hypothetical protein
MSTIVTRGGKGSPLTHNEVDANFTNLNTDKVEKTAADITGGTIDNTSIGVTTPSTVNATTITGQTARVNGTGSNLLLQSNTLNTTWAVQNTSVTGSQSDPFGGSTAWRFAADGINTTHGLSQSISFINGLIYTYSAYFKKNTNNFIQLSFGAAVGTQFVNFDLDAGTVGTTSASTTGTITSVGGGWYRCSMTATATSTATAPCIMYIVNSASADRGQINALTTSVFAFSAQVEIGSTANTYIPTTTTAVYGTPTLSFSGVSSIGLESNGSLYASSAGTGNVRFYTNNVVSEQMRVSNTTSAVDYLQVTGSATGNPANITMSAQGSDANINLVFTPKGTGTVKFGTFTAGILVQTGYITITDSGGTSRRLLIG